MIEKMYELGIDGRELERDMASVRRFLPAPIRSAALQPADRHRPRLPRSSGAGSTIVDPAARPKEEPLA